MVKRVDWTKIKDSWVYVHTYVYVTLKCKETTDVSVLEHHMNKKM